MCLIKSFLLKRKFTRTKVRKGPNHPLITLQTRTQNKSLDEPLSSQAPETRACSRQGVEPGSSNSSACPGLGFQPGRRPDPTFRGRGSPGKQIQNPMSKGGPRKSYRGTGCLGHGGGLLTLSSPGICLGSSVPPAVEGQSSRFQSKDMSQEMNDVGQPGNGDPRERGKLSLTPCLSGLTAHQERNCFNGTSAIPAGADPGFTLEAAGGWDEHGEKPRGRGRESTICVFLN